MNNRGEPESGAENRLHTVTREPPAAPPPGHPEPTGGTDVASNAQATNGSAHSSGASAPTGSGPGHSEPIGGTEVASNAQATNGSAHSSGAVAPTGSGPGHPPSLVRQAWNLATSLADFVADGCRTVSAEQYHERLEICDGCPHRRNNRCMKCGCNLSLKAQGRAFKCPEGKWPAAVNC